METSEIKKGSTSCKRPNKHLVEKKRRDRINTSLNQLKSLVLQALNKEESKYSKLEKADILEMTVRHLKAIQKNTLAVAATSDPSVASKYRAGYSECATEVTRYLNTVDCGVPEVQNRLMRHLAGNMQVRQEEAQSHNAQQTGNIQNHPTQHPLQPIQVQIPQATQAGSLPGSTQILQLANGSIQSVPVQGLQTVTLSPVSPQAQVTGTFQVVPTLQHFQQSQPLALVLPNGLPIQSPLHNTSQDSNLSLPRDIHNNSRSTLQTSSDLGKKIRDLYNAESMQRTSMPPCVGKMNNSFKREISGLSPNMHRPSKRVDALMQQPSHCGKMKSVFQDRNVWRPW